MATVIRGDDNFDSADAGKVLQVVQATSNSETIPNASWTNITGASVSITPSSTSSKVLITFNTGGMSTGTPDSVTYTIQMKSDIDADLRVNHDQSNNGGVNGLVMIATEIGG